MTKQEISEQLTNFKAEMDSLILKINAFETALQRINEEDVIAKYKNDYCKGEQYYFDLQGNIDYITAGESDAFEKQSNPYSNYLTEELAEQAKKLRDFNDKLLAFKYCYDRDYKPVFSGDYDNRAYFVHYDSDDGEYICGWESIYDRNTVYFSSEEIAQKCCDWLNSFKEEI